MVYIIIIIMYTFSVWGTVRFIYLFILFYFIDLIQEKGHIDQNN